MRIKIISEKTFLNEFEKVESIILFYLNIVAITTLRLNDGSRPYANFPLPQEPAMFF
jgi:hypothetical protein